MAKKIKESGPPTKWADCTDEQKEIVARMCLKFSELSGLTEPDSWPTKIKTWCDPLVHVMNATGWTEAGMNRAVRVMRQVIGDLILDRTEIPNVLKIYRRTCNVLGRTQFSRSDFPELTYAEFVEMMRQELRSDDNYAIEILAHQADLYKRASETMQSLPGDSVEEKLAQFEKLLYGKHGDDDGQ